MSSEGWVYVLTNSCMPGLVKIGKTMKNPKNRASELYTTGVPGEFTVEYAALVKDCDSAEKDAHFVLASKRENKNREYFRVDTIEAIAVVANVSSKYGRMIEQNSFAENEALISASKRMEQEIRDSIDAEKKRLQEEADKSAANKIYNQFCDEQSDKCRMYFYGLIKKSKRNPSFLLYSISSIPVSLIVASVTQRNPDYGSSMLIGFVIFVAIFFSRVGGDTEESKRLESDMREVIKGIASSSACMCNSCGKPVFKKSSDFSAARCDICGAFNSIPARPS